MRLSESSAPPPSHLFVEKSHTREHFHVQIATLTLIRTHKCRQINDSMAQSTERHEIGSSRRMSSLLTTTTSAERKARHTMSRKEEAIDGYGSLCRWQSQRWNFIRARAHGQQLPRCSRRRADDADRINTCCRRAGAQKQAARQESELNISIQERCLMNIRYESLQLACLVVLTYILREKMQIDRHRSTSLAHPATLMRYSSHLPDEGALTCSHSGRSLRTYPLRKSC